MVQMAGKGYVVVTGTHHRVGGDSRVETRDIIGTILAAVFGALVTMWTGRTWLRYRAKKEKRSAGDG